MPHSNIYQLILSRRTIRRFQQKEIPGETLSELVQAARLAPSGSNLQPLTSIIVNRKELLPEVFFTTRWAGYITPKGTPSPEERPTAYIVVLINRNIRAAGGYHDSGAAMMSMILAAWEKGIGSCWIGSVEREQLAALLAIPAHFEIDCVLALGYPAEQP
ncbi:MAG TPA: nitroreductase, partial [Bacteroidetes bacterium]|nr:nitroreductase [Bacteroidota bacterium]